MKLLRGLLVGCALLAYGEVALAQDGEVALAKDGDRVTVPLSDPSRPGGRSLTCNAQDAWGLGEPTHSTRHMRHLPAMERRS